MPIAVWLALLVCGVAVGGSAVVLFLRARDAWRAFGAFGRATGDALTSVLESASAAETRAVSLTGGGERLAGASARLQESLATLAALRAALGEAQGLARRLRGTVPRK